jgi:hypothetical protein
MSVPSIVLMIAACAGIVWSIAKDDRTAAALFLIALVLLA